MKILNKNAIQALYHNVEQLNPMPKEGWKCIYFKIPTYQERQANALMRFDETIIAHMIARMPGQAYFCESGEMFILYRGSHNSLVSRLSLYLWSLCTDVSMASPGHQLFSHFDLNLQWASFRRFCEKRYLEVIVRDGLTPFTPRFAATLPEELFKGQHVAGYLQ